MKKHYWKVVCLSRCGPGARDFQHVSSNTTDSKLLLTYEIGKKTIPKVGKIFVFNTRKAARLYRGDRNFQRVLKVKIDGTPVKAYHRSILRSFEGVVEFWKNPNNPPSRVYAPGGTYFVDSVTPVEESR